MVIIIVILTPESLYGNTWQYFWTGGRQLDGYQEPGQGFIWNGTGEQIQNSMWQEGEPNNLGGSENHVTIAFHVPDSDKDVALNDERSDTAYGAICEIPPL